jgi:two-component system sensor histidine kinase ChvG
LLVLAGLLSRGISRPIEALSEATQNVAEAGWRCPSRRDRRDRDPQSLPQFRGHGRPDRAPLALSRDFAAAVSHELKTPIAGIKGALELLAEHPEMSEEERRRFLGNAGADADRLSHLLRRLLDLARADMAIAPEDAATAPEGPALKVADAHRRAPGFSVEVRSPACRRSRRRPSCSRRCSRRWSRTAARPGPSLVVIAAAARRSKIMLSVADDGAGIAEADRERIFEPFHTGRRGEGGSGLGLSIARSLLAACGGTIAAMPGEAEPASKSACRGRGRSSPQRRLGPQRVKGTGTHHPLGSQPSPR